MEWKHKGVPFQISTKPMGPFVLAVGRAPQVGPFVRIRPFSALGRSKEQALELLKGQIAAAYRRTPAVTPPTQAR